MIKLELPTDNLIISEIDTCFYDYYLELLTKIPSISGLCNKIVMICGSMETFKTLITGEWDEITALQTESNICEYFLVGKFYSELSEMKASDGKAVRDGWINNLEDAISRYSGMDNIISRVLFKETSNFKKFKKENIKVFSGFIELNKVLEEFLDYAMFRDKYRLKLWNLYKCEVCPYCNLIPISNHKGFSTADIEHFYCRSIFSLFSVSKFNLIPGCKDCNRQFKGTKYFYHNLRYEGLDDKFKFSFTINSKQNVIEQYLKNAETISETEISLQEEFPTDDVYVKKAISDLKLILRYTSSENLKIICRFLKQTNYFRKSSEQFLSMYGGNDETFESIFTLSKTNYLDRKFMNNEKGKFKADILDMFTEYTKDLL